MSGGKSLKTSTRWVAIRVPRGVEKLQAKEKLYCVYVGPGKDYRAIYQIRDESLLVLVVKVGDRKEVYRRLE